MRAGQMRHKVTVQASTPTRNDVGAEVESWSDEFTVWASVEPLKGRKFMEGAAQTQTVSHRVMVRYRDGFTPEKRLKFGMRFFTIVSVIHVEERQQMMQLMCQELV